MTNKTNTFLAVWDCYGLEYLTDLTQWHKDAMISILKDEGFPKGPPIGELMLRARMNPQRNYEIYTFNADKNLSCKMIEHSFKITPQAMADWIRKNGEEIYSDRDFSEKRVIA